MDVNQLATVLQHCMDPDGAIRSQAEQQLLAFSTSPGGQSALLQIITIKEFPMPIHQQAIIRLKNVIQSSWSVRKGKASVISEQDRNVIKSNLLEAILCQPAHVIRVQLLECLYVISKTDFPEAWPDLLPGVLQNLQGQDVPRIYGSMCVLQRLFKRYQFKGEKGRQPVEQMCTATYPLLLTFAKQVIGQDTTQAYQVLHMICKSFHCSVFMSVPVALKANPETVNPWMDFLLCVIGNKNLPKETWPQFKQSPEELREHPLWKAKKWAARAVRRLFERFGMPKTVLPATRPFAEHFFNNWAARAMGTMMEVLKQQKDGMPTSERVRHHCFSYLGECVPFAALYKLMKPHLQFLLLGATLDELCMNEQDLILWREDPHDYIRRQMDVMQEFSDPRQSASTFLVQTVRVRTKDSLSLVLGAVQQIFNTYRNTAEAQRNVLLKAGAMRMFNALRKLLLSQEQNRESIETIIVNDIIPEFTSTTGFLRALACDVCAEYARLDWGNDQHSMMAMKGVAQMLGDAELPVRLQALLAVERLIENNDHAIEVLRPHLSTVLEYIFQMIDEVGNEDVVGTLTTLVDGLGEDILPFAQSVTTRLRDMAGALLDADADNDDAAMTAMQCLKCISTILYALEGKPDAIIALEGLLAPLIDKLIHPDMMEFFDDTLNMITCLMYFPKRVTPFAWTLLPRLCEAVLTWAGSDFVPNLIPPLDNYISLGGDVMVQSQDPKYLDMVLSLCQQLFSQEHGDHCASNACKILETILAHLRHKVDHVVSPIMQLCVDRLRRTEDHGLQLMLLDVIGGCAYYNPAIFHAVCRQGGEEFTQAVYSYWLQLLSEMKDSEKHQKIAILGLSSLFLVPLDTAPQGMQQNPQGVLNGLLSVCAQLRAYCEKHQGVGEVEEEDFDANVAFLDIDEDEDLEDGADQEQMAALIARLQAGEEEWMPSDDIDEDNYESPLDDVDEFVFFCTMLESLKSAGGQGAQLYQHWGQQLGAQEQTLGLVYQYAEKRRQDEMEKHRKAEEALANGTQ